jgi:quinol monooxygenase YgiN
MLVLAAHYYGKKGNGDAILEGLRKVAPLVKANEPGCKMYQACRSKEDPDYILIYEHYDDEAALAAHRETPYFKEIIEGQVIPLLEKRERVFYTLEIA